GTRLVTANVMENLTANKTNVWDLTAAPPKKLHSLYANGNHAAFSPDGKLCAVTASTFVRVFDTATWEPTTKSPLAAQVGGVGLSLGHGRGVAFTPDGATLAVGADARIVKLFDLKGGAGTLFVHGAPLRSIAVSRDGGSLAAVGGNGVLKVWRLGAPPPPAAVRLPGPCSVLAFAPDDRTLAA